MKNKIFFNNIREFFQTIIELYDSCETDNCFVDIFNSRSYTIENFDCKDRSKMKIDSIDDVFIVLKAKYCLELPKTICTALVNAHYIAGNISRDILLGNFRYKTLSTKQKSMFSKSMHVDFSNLDSFDLSQLCDVNFIKDKDKKFPL